MGRIFGQNLKGCLPHFEWFIHETMDVTDLVLQSLYRWLPPPLGVLKMNVEAGLVGEGSVGFGVIFGVAHEQVMACASTCVAGTWNTTISENKVMTFELKLTSVLSFNRLIAESNHKICIDLLLTTDCFGNGLGLSIQDCLQLSSHFLACLWLHML